MSKKKLTVIHPLDDAPENKVDAAGIGPIKMTRSVRLALLSLRVYLILMFVLVVYRLIGMATQ